ncbi:methyltransferase [Terriglobus sp. TAA 43]|uniref:methyltransferase domain-containing protein n=1 Tax=Terriglobus sp. TAA 43 TaxID=278961 RepID=UPI0006484C9A|nr:methyltransferase [Terriglobus sp. TAA 43]
MRFNLVDLSTRVDLDELMDGPCTYEDYRSCLQSLEDVNQLLHGYQPTLEWLRTHFGKQDRPLHLVDVGSGGGGLLRHIENDRAFRGQFASLTGIDLNPRAARFCNEETGTDSSVEWFTGDVFTYRPPHNIDLVVSSLFTHHLTEDEIVRFIQWMENQARDGWFINDLRRSAFSFYSFRALAWAMRWHRFVQHDGPVSIRRGFLPEDWIRMCTAAGISQDSIRIRNDGPGRLCVSRIKT